MPKSFKKTGLKRLYKKKNKPKAKVETKPAKEVEPTKKITPSYEPMGGKTGPIAVIAPPEPEPEKVEPEKIEEPVVDKPKPEEEEIDKTMEPINTKDTKIEREEEHIHEVLEEQQVNPMQEFFDDCALIQSQARDPYLRKPTFDVGGPVIHSYLLWLQLAELMKINRKLSASVTEKLNKEEENA